MTTQFPQFNKPKHLDGRGQSPNPGLTGDAPAGSKLPSAHAAISAGSADVSAAEPRLQVGDPLTRAQIRALLAKYDTAVPEHDDDLFAHRYNSYPDWEMPEREINPWTHSVLVASRRRGQYLWRTLTAAYVSLPLLHCWLERGKQSFIAGELPAVTDEGDVSPDPVSLTISLFMEWQSGREMALAGAVDRLAKTNPESFIGRVDDSDVNWNREKIAEIEAKNKASVAEQPVQLQLSFD